MFKEVSMKAKLKETGWLKCRKLDEGIFPTEILVSGETIDGRTFTLYADELAIKTLKNDEVGLWVTILSLKGNEAVVVLPDFPFEMNRIIRVRRDNLLTL